MGRWVVVLVLLISTCNLHAEEFAIPGVVGKRDLKAERELEEKWEAEARKKAIYEWFEKKYKEAPNHFLIGAVAISLLAFQGAIVLRHERNSKREELKREKFMLETGRQCYGLYHKMGNSVFYARTFNTGKNRTQFAGSYFLHLDQPSPFDPKPATEIPPAGPTEVAKPRKWKDSQFRYAEDSNGNVTLSSLTGNPLRMWNRSAGLVYLPTRSGHFRGWVLTYRVSTDGQISIRRGEGWTPLPKMEIFTDPVDKHVFSHWSVADEYMDLTTDTSIQ